MWRLSHAAENSAGFQDIGLEPEQPNRRAQSRRTGSEQSFWIILVAIAPYTSPRSRERTLTVSVGCADDQKRRCQIPAGPITCYEDGH
ncbi:hypothetical protein AV530_005967 [Patagioenas fasciata monilis]|uniref:Uncharacterized protein n=1 Tax=Patagioenas fasciata monilis TaxID=372326 RepID=A0A1V4JPI7_PATFA|nr:hypothetical protein AV530_005967 [Patagioenas fasciata monilis]